MEDDLFLDLDLDDVGLAGVDGTVGGQSQLEVFVVGEHSVLVGNSEMNLGGVSYLIG